MKIQREISIVTELRQQNSAMAAVIIRVQNELKDVKAHRDMVLHDRSDTQKRLEECLGKLTAGEEMRIKLASDLTDANHKALNYKSQRDQALRDNARLRGLLTLLADNIKASANTCGALEAMAHDLPATAPENEGG